MSRIEDLLWGKKRKRTDGTNDEYSYEEAKTDILNSPFAESLGWKKGDHLTEAGEEVAMSAGAGEWTKVGPDMWVNEKENRTVEILEEAEGFYNVTIAEAGVRRTIASAETYSKAVKLANEFMKFSQ